MKDAKKVTLDRMEELVDYTAPMLHGDNVRDILVAVNGETIRIKRGATVKIKRKFLEALKNASAQEYAAYKLMAQAQNISGPTARM